MAADVESYIEASGLADLFTTPPDWPIEPEWHDLVRLHRAVRERKVMTVLEFGSGCSSIVLAHALAQNKSQYASEIEELGLRRDNPFHLYSVEDVPAYAEQVVRCIPSDLAEFVTIHVTSSVMTTFCGRIATCSETLPNVCPDLIYLDGPSQSTPTGHISGISTNHPDRMPMSCDILRIEHFVLPGALIIVDGRTANARFLRANLQRSWRYAHHEAKDVHIFELDEAPLGPNNRTHIRWALGSDWKHSLCDKPAFVP